MDFKDKIEDIVKKLKSDPQLMEKFNSDPVAALEGILGIDLPDDQVKPLIAGVKAKLNVGDVAEGLGKLKKLF